MSDNKGNSRESKHAEETRLSSPNLGLVNKLSSEKLNISEPISILIKEQGQKVLGIYWMPSTDKFYFAIRLNMNSNKGKAMLIQI